MRWADILSIEWVPPIGITVAGGPIIVLLLGAVIIVVVARFIRRRHLVGWEIVEADINFGQIGHVKIRRNPEVIRIAHQAWTELQTRKAALPFDEEHDVITEVYDSWYALFGEFRKLIKSIPAERIRGSKDTEKLINLMVNVLNQGLRPHLTQWQARFRSWTRRETETHPDESPQETQRRFPDYERLAADLRRVNGELQRYGAFLKRIAHGEAG